MDGNTVRARRQGCGKNGLGTLRWKADDLDSVTGTGCEFSPARHTKMKLRSAQCFMVGKGWLHDGGYPEHQRSHVCMEGQDPRTACDPKQTVDQVGPCQCGKIDRPGSKGKACDCKELDQKRCDCPASDCQSVDKSGGWNQDGKFVDGATCPPQTSAACKDADAIKKVGKVRIIDRVASGDIQQGESCKDGDDTALPSQLKGAENVLGEQKTCPPCKEDLCKCTGRGNEIHCSVSKQRHCAPDEECYGGNNVVQFGEWSNICKKVESGQKPKKKVRKKDDCNKKYVCDKLGSSNFATQPGKKSQWYICGNTKLSCMGACICDQPGLSGSDLLDRNPKVGYRYCRSVGTADLSPKYRNAFGKNAF